MSQVNVSFEYRCFEGNPAELSRALSIAQKLYISAKEPHIVFDRLLDEALKLTKSKYGFIGEVLYDNADLPYLKTYSLTNISWNNEMRQFYESHKEQGFEFHSLKNLFGHVIINKTPVISNDPTNDPRRGGIPIGHPPIKSFLGLPIFRHSKLVGMVGVANRSKGYCEEIIHYLEPFTDTCGLLIEAINNDKKRLLAEHTLGCTEARLRTLNHLVPVGVFRLDPFGKCVFVNRRFSEITGIESDEAMGEGWIQTMHPKDRNILQSRCANSLKTQKPFTQEIRFYFKKRNVIWCLVHAVIEYGNDNELFGLVGSLTDITKLKRLESQTKTLLKKSNSASEAKSSFIANISHELRTPLTSILGFSQLLVQNPKSQESLRYVPIINHNAEKLLLLVDDLLNISKIEANALQVAKTDFFIVNELRDLFIHYSEKAKQKGLRFFVKSKGPIPSVVCSDPLRIRQIVSNLLNNAIKFTSKGEVSVTLKIDQQRKNSKKDMLYIEVKDTGIGIRKTDRKNLFKRFSQIEQPDARSEGSGLGLFVSKQIARILGGDVVLTPVKDGVGSCFFVSISLDSIPQPVNLITIDNLESVLSLEKKKGNLKYSPPILTGKHVLLVEDSPDTRALFSHILRNSGIKVEYAKDGREALERCEKRDYDLVLMDIQIPIRDGYETTRILRNKGYKAPIIALTACAMPNEKERCMEAGCDEFLSKPINPNELLESVKAFISPQ